MMLNEEPFSMSLGMSLFGRSSVRAYTPDPVGPEFVQELLAAAVRAPTAMHREPWAFVVVQDRELLGRISDIAKPIFLAQLQRAGGEPSDSRSALHHFADPKSSIFHDAGTLIVICGPAAEPFASADCWLAAGNLMLAAFASGLGSCVIGSSLPALNLEEIRGELGIAPGLVAIAPIIVGFPASDEEASARKEPRILSWK